ncbi:Methyltransferase [Sphingomonas antarctica]|uniref:class I SAM-dependent methyltransferase n=1 Tax=Sphingomonas antarctica TaxID=2040274 RepID=UPI0039E96A25
MRRIILTAGMLAVAVPLTAKTMYMSPYAEVLANPARPADDRAKDAARKPEVVLQFMGVKPGQHIGDFVTGGGYFSRILASAVGPKGKVYAFQPAEFIKFKPSYADAPNGIHAAFPNADPVISPFDAPAFPEKLDAIVTIQNFHDLYLKPWPAGEGDRAAAALFAALKPGGVLVVVDHAAVAGSGTTASDSLHRIDPAAVIAALTKAGFKLEAKDMTTFANVADPHTASVFAPEIRGKTDQFMLRFRKGK